MFVETSFEKRQTLLTGETGILLLYSFPLLASTATYDCDFFFSGKKKKESEPEQEGKGKEGNISGVCVCGTKVSFFVKAARYRRFLGL